MADTHLKEVEYGSSSPYEANRIANMRTRHVVARLNQIAQRWRDHDDAIEVLGGRACASPTLIVFES